MTPRRVRVLMVEDDVPLRALNRLLLEESGRFTIVGEAEDGRQAIARAAELQPELVLLDVAMPVMGGLEALPAIRRACPSAKIIVLTMLQREATEQQAMASGADGFIDKGLDSPELLARLDGVARELLQAPVASAQRPDSQRPRVK